MIKVGQYTIHDWYNTQVTYNYRPYYGKTRNAYIKHDGCDILVSYVRVQQVIDIKTASLRYSIIIGSNEFCNLFENIYGPKIFNKHFDSIFEAQNFVDKTLIKLSKLMVFT